MEIQEKINLVISHLEKTLETAPEEAIYADKSSKYRKKNISVEYSILKDGMKIMGVNYGNESATMRFSEDNEINWSNKPTWPEAIDAVVRVINNS